jgi:nitrogen fixation/metabolism regulation signal transduction histidine kinase
LVVEELEEGVVVTDPQLRALCWNGSALRILDLDATRIAGRTAQFQHDLRIVVERDAGARRQPHRLL